MRQKQRQQKTCTTQQHKPLRHVFERSTEAESDATSQLSWVKPYEEAMPIGQFMRARSGIRSHSEPIHNFDPDFQTSAASRSEAVLPSQSSVPELYTNSRSEFSQDESIISDIGANHSVDSDTAIQTGSDPDLINC